MASRALIRHTLTCRLGALTLVAQTVAVGVPSSEPPFNSALGTTRWTLAFVRKPPPLASLLRLMTHPSPASRPRPTLSTRPSARSRPSRSPPSRSSGSSGSRSTVPGTGSRRRAARCSTLRRRSSLSARGKTSSSSSKKGRGRARKGPLENGALPAGVARARGGIGHDLFSKTGWHLMTTTTTTTLQPRASPSPRHRRAARAGEPSSTRLASSARRASARGRPAWARTSWHQPARDASRGSSSRLEVTLLVVRG
jgi:hypothetical protein